MSVIVIQSSQRDVMDKIGDLVEQLDEEDYGETHQQWNTLKTTIMDRLSRAALIEQGNLFKEHIINSLHNRQNLLENVKKLAKKHKEVNNTLSAMMANVDQLNMEITSLGDGLIKMRAFELVEDSKLLTRRASKTTSDSQLIDVGIDFVDKLKDRIRSIQTDMLTLNGVLPLVEQMIVDMTDRSIEYVRITLNRITSTIYVLLFV